MSFTLGRGIRKPMESPVVKGLKDDGRRVPESKRHRTGGKESSSPKHGLGSANKGAFRAENFGKDRVR